MMEVLNVVAIIVAGLMVGASVQTTKRYIGCKQNLREAVNDRFEISVAGDAA